MRWRAHDYSLPGAYFVTVVAEGRRCLFGSVHGDVMHLNEAGRMVAECWESIGTRFERAITDDFIVMPNHTHGVLVVEARSLHPQPVSGFAQEPPLDADRSERRDLSTQLIGKVMAFFKSETTRQYAHAVRAHR